jgi:hypothetical protein
LEFNIDIIKFTGTTALYKTQHASRDIQTVGNINVRDQWQQSFTSLIDSRLKKSEEHTVVAGLESDYKSIVVNRLNSVTITDFSDGIAGYSMWFEDKSSSISFWNKYFNGLTGFKLQG